MPDTFCSHQTIDSHQKFANSMDSKIYPDKPEKIIPRISSSHLRLIVTTSVPELFSGIPSFRLASLGA